MKQVILWSSLASMFVFIAFLLFSDYKISQREMTLKINVEKKVSKSLKSK